MQQFFQRPFNPAISVDPLSNEGYSTTDLSRRYYGGTFLLYENNEGQNLPCLCHGFNSRTEAAIEYPTGGGSKDTTIVDIGRLSRFIIPNGFYLREGKEPLLYRYLVNRSMKKGISSEFVSLKRLTNGGSLSGSNFNLSALMHLLYPLESKSDREFIISRRNLVAYGKIYTMYNTLSVGGFKDGVLDTPFEAIRERYEEGMQNA